ncbi:dihydroorotase [Nitrospinaceae bacterium]|nr:dihydroorotase [Nitrospinaceae bacterium]
MTLVIKNGRVIDPANSLDEPKDLLIDKGRIKAIESPGSISFEAGKKPSVIDAKGCVVCPGLIDMHVHFREPGFEYKETITSGCQSAAAGGFTSVAVMPNTNPVNDTRAVTEHILSIARAEGIINVYPIAAITQKLEGERLSEMADLKDAGAIAFSDDGRPVINNELMRRAFEYSKMFKLPLIQHSEMLDLTEGGCMNEGIVSTELGLKGMPAEAEDIMVYRDIALLEKTGGQLHVAHISSKNSVDLVRQAKSRGLSVTCEVAPHHFTLTDEAVRGYDTNTKMSPPLRTIDDVEAIKEGLQDGTIDIIATDHAPHDIADKQVEYQNACFGIVGLETALPLSLKLVDEKILPMADVIKKLTSTPADIFNLEAGSLSLDNKADLLIFNPNLEYSIDISKFHSKSKNSPFDGWKVKGKVIHTLVKGKTAYSANEN